MRAATPVEPNETRQLQTDATAGGLKATAALELGVTPLPTPLRVKHCSSTFGPVRNTDRKRFQYTAPTMYVGFIYDFVLVSFVEAKKRMDELDETANGVGAGAAVAYLALITRVASREPRVLLCFTPLILLAGPERARLRGAVFNETDSF
ncbi:hypothetical protein EVAR_89833_1 [Eumeta japonica]|uniref:Uncharacterized protein n=1 Tax=Eumeta variegata TaxID=151549 RepID=A0A4C2ABT0_EUMVA|nr:hypothetical protein EVAR_89833_1 [Eumeta japonica]